MSYLHAHRKNTEDNTTNSKASKNRHKFRKFELKLAVHGFHYWLKKQGASSTAGRSCENRTAFGIHSAVS